MGIAHGFFIGRHPLDLRMKSGGRTPYKYQNVPIIIGTLISNRIATLHELDTIYGVQDAYDMLEILIVDGYNNANAIND
jgi:hypothetical protein